MARYFFDIVADGIRFEDFEGEEFADLKIAHLHAINLVCGTISLFRGASLDGWRIEIASPPGWVKLIVLFTTLIRKDSYYLPNQTGHVSGQKANG